MMNIRTVPAILPIVIARGAKKYDRGIILGFDGGANGMD